MALNVVAEVDPAALFTGGNYDSNGGFLIAGVTGPGSIFYYDRLDFYAGDWQPGTGAGEWVRWDPLLLSNTGGLFDDVAAPGQVDGVNANRIAVGQWDRSGNVQRVYLYRITGGANGQFNEVEPLALNQVVQLDPWPNVGNVQHRGSLISTDPGFYNLGGSSQWCVFEDWGFAFCPALNVRHTDAVAYDGVPALISLTTGAASIVQGLITAFGSQTHQFSHPHLFSQSVQFHTPQFAPDDISTGPAPRGLMVLTSEGTNSPADSTRSRFWIQVVDWNPLNVPGTPSRVHLRQRLLSAVDFLKSAGGTFGAIHESGSPIQKVLLYHPRTNRVLFPSSGTAGVQLAPGETKFLVISATPATSFLTDPSPVEQVLTGRTVPFVTEALGTLLEKIGGINVAFQLRRVSSVDEVLATTPPPGETVVVANGPISPTDPNVSPVVVKENGTPLTETTHYTLNRALGQIIFVAPKPLGGGAVYQATYRHFDTPTAPAHGILLNTSAVTDVTGAA
ncbi:MAG: hypothetical protein ACRDTJ_16935, partial [Pseudonocardiaceae bacterium]